MKTKNQAASFLAGVVLANAVPHFVHGISGDRFPTPFSDPPGRGLSSPTVNVIWGLANAAAGYSLFKAGKLSRGKTAGVISFLAGAAVISTVLSVAFTKKHAN
jgi:hypothetical protein